MRALKLTNDLARKKKKIPVNKNKILYDVNLK